MIAFSDLCAHILYNIFLVKTPLFLTQMIINVVHDFYTSLLLLSGTVQKFLQSCTFFVRQERLNSFKIPVDQKVNIPMVIFKLIVH